jgi:hypothetical protein
MDLRPLGPAPRLGRGRHKTGETRRVPRTAALRRGVSRTRQVRAFSFARRQTPGERVIALPHLWDIKHGDIHHFCWKLSNDRRIPQFVENSQVLNAFKSWLHSIMQIMATNLTAI